MDETLIHARTLRRRKRDGLVGPSKTDRQIAERNHNNDAGVPAGRNAAP